MVIRPRPVPSDLTIMRSLNARMNLVEKEKNYFYYREKGYEGEVQFDKLTEKLQCNCYILNDLLLEHNNSEFQIDSSIIIQNTLNFFEIKNNEGDYCFHPDKFTNKSGDEIKNPYIQLQRTESLLRQYLRHHGYNLKVEGQVAFVNPEFTLYQAPLDKPFIFSNQLNRLMKNLNMKKSNLTDRDLNLANQLISDHKTKSRYTILPEYKYLQLKKGTLCATCYSFMLYTGGRKLVCRNCGAEEGIESAVLRSVEELKLLFPGMKMTTFLIYEWCRGVVSKKVIRCILKKNFKVMSYGRWYYYE